MTIALEFRQRIAELVFGERYRRTRWIRMDTNTLEQLIETSFPSATVEVTDLNGGGDHFQVLVVSERFDGLKLVQRHRLVYDALGDLMRARIHALALSTLTPTEHQNALITSIGRS